MYSRGSLEHETSRSSTTQKKDQIKGAPHPDLELPAPSYSYDFQMSVDLNPKVAVGAVPSGGVRNWISFSGGNWAAKWGSGTVLVSSSPPRILAQSSPRRTYNCVQGIGQRD